MSKIKDTALDAMKRAARAVLKDELKALRQKARDASEAAFQQKLKHENEVRKLERQLASAISTEHKTLGVLEGMRQRTRKALTWADQNRNGDLGMRACLEYVQGPPSLAALGCGPSNYYINPFDRWQVTPALRD